MLPAYSCVVVALIWVVFGHWMTYLRDRKEAGKPALFPSSGLPPKPVIRPQLQEPETPRPFTFIGHPAPAFWLAPDWSGGDNLRDGATPFWMIEPFKSNKTALEANLLRTGDPQAFETIASLEAEVERRIALEKAKHLHALEMELAQIKREQAVWEGLHRWTR